MRREGALALPLRYEGVGSGFVIAKGIALKQSTSEKVVIAKGEALKQSPSEKVVIAKGIALKQSPSENLEARASQHFRFLWVRHILDFFENGGLAYFRNREFQYFGGGQGIVQGAVVPKVRKPQGFR